MIHRVVVYLVSTSSQTLRFSTRLHDFYFFLCSYVHIYSLVVGYFVNEKSTIVVVFYFKHFSNFFGSNVVPVVCACNYQ